MARANRHHLPGYVWHITHRCHKKEFLLKFEKDKKRWTTWLFEAKKRFGLCILNRRELGNLLGIKKDTHLLELHWQWVEKILKNGSNKRDAKWTKSIAVGDKEFELDTKAKLGAKAISRKVSGENGNYELKESQIPYSPLFAPEKCALSSKNSFFWNQSQ